MYVPRVRSHFEVPRRLITGLAGGCAVLTAVLVAALFTRSTSDDSTLTAIPINQASTDSAGSIVYSRTLNGFDLVVVRDVESGEERRVASFPVGLTGLHLRGSTSPGGDQVAVLNLRSSSGPAARLSFVELGASVPATRDVEGTFDYLSTMAWSPDGSTLTLTARTGSDPNRGFALVQVDAPSLEIRTLRVFDTALEVAPVGYGVEGNLLFVVVNQEGSTLWTYADGETTARAKFSPGLTSDWSLSPDGSRLAFVDHLGVGDRTRAGRVLSVATGKVADFATEGEQLGAAWRPDAPAPDFGGPDGSVALSGAQEGSYLVPLKWTPNARYLIATVVTPAADGTVDENIEIISTSGRSPLATGQNSRFLGLVPGE